MRLARKEDYIAIRIVQVTGSGTKRRYIQHHTIRVYDTTPAGVQKVILAALKRAAKKG